jgi:hypothetical protein
MDFNKPFIKEAYETITQAIHKKEVVEILEDGKYYYKFLPIAHEDNRSGEMIVKVVELSDTDFREDNKVYRYSLEELINGRASYLEREAKNQEAFNKKFPSLAILDNLNIISDNS